MFRFRTPFILKITIITAIFPIVLSACSGLSQYRTSYATCSSEKEDCTYQRLPTDHGANFDLAFIEFDDQGQLFDRKQLKNVIENINAVVEKDDVLLVVFAHGWKHNAKPGDENINNFKRVLADLAETELEISKLETNSKSLKQSSNEPIPPSRRVVGVFLGWRGGSLTVPVLNNLTFWERKNTASKVGHAGVTEVLSRLESIKLKKDSITNDNRTRLVVIGHSFGGAVVYTALSQILVDRFIESTGDRTQHPVTGFGSLVVLLNPAFEATLYSTLRDMSNEHPEYLKNQLPVMAILTSEDDDATGVSFPIGRFFSTLFEKERTTTRYNVALAEYENISESKTNKFTVGHFEPYITHELNPSPCTIPLTNMKAASSNENDTKSLQVALKVGKDWENDVPGSTICFDRMALSRSKKSMGRNPYLNVRVDKSIIPNHGDIYGKQVEEFVRELILISTLVPKQVLIKAFEIAP